MCCQIDQRSHSDRLKKNFLGRYRLFKRNSLTLVPKTSGMSPFSSLHNELQIKRYSSYRSSDDKSDIFINIVVVASFAVPFLIDPFNSVIRNTFIGH